MNQSKIELLESRLFLSTTLPTPISEGDWSNGYKLNVISAAGGVSLATYSFSVQQNERVAIAVKPLHGKAVSVALLDASDDTAYSPSATKLTGVVHLGTYTFAVSDPNSVGYRLTARATPVLAPVTFFSTFGSGRFIAGGTTLDTTTPTLGDFSGKRNLLFTSSTDATADYAFTVDRDERVTVRLQSPQKKNLELELINADSVQPSGDQKWTDHQMAFVTAGTYFISVSSLNLQLPAGFQIQFQITPVMAKSLRPALTLAPATVTSATNGDSISTNGSLTIGSGPIISGPQNTDDKVEDNSQTGYGSSGSVTENGSNTYFSGGTSALIIGEGGADADLSGAVTGTDYTLVNNGYSDAIGGWGGAVFNYDGTVDGADYSLIDNAFNSLTGTPPAAIASPPSMNANGDGSASNVAPAPAIPDGPTNPAAGEEAILDSASSGWTLSNGDKWTFNSDGTGDRLQGKNDSSFKWSAPFGEIEIHFTDGSTYYVSKQITVLSYSTSVGSTVYDYDLQDQSGDLAGTLTPL